MSNAEAKQSEQTNIVLVTDPMCSWCWGMADDFRQVLIQFENQLNFDLMLGGINTHGTQPIGDYGRRYLRRLWQDVATTTGIKFGELPQQDYVHNSTAPCLVLEAARILDKAVPFDLLRALQRAFFQDGLPISDRDVALSVAGAQGYSVTSLQDGMEAAITQEQLKFQFANANQFGTDALPSLLVQRPGEAGLSLLAGGYVSADMFAQIIQAQI